MPDWPHVEHNAEMFSAWRGKLLRPSIAVLLVILLLAIVGQFWRPGFAIWTFGSSHWRLSVGTNSFAILHVISDDPSAIAAFSDGRWQTVVDPSSLKGLHSQGIPLVLHRRAMSYALRNGRGSIYASVILIGYAPWAFISLLVICANIEHHLREPLLRFFIKRHLRRKQLKNLDFGELCPTCGYDLRATSDRCPECGLAFSRKTVIVPADGAATS